MNNKINNMPGFTAEASVYKTRERYALVAVSHYHTDGTIRPASCVGVCVGECLQYGHIPAQYCVRMCRLECLHP